MSESEDIRRIVRERYGAVAAANSSCCGPGSASASGCGCGSVGPTSEALGYEGNDLALIPAGADLALGCGNPLALLELNDGETVLDLGSGAGIDCFLAANRVGTSGRVIGVDMTPEMIERARRNAEQGGYDNVEFRLGEIEHMPVEDGSVDSVISNCVINLVTDKRAAFAEAYRVLRPGGRLSLSDIVLRDEIPAFIRDSMAAYVGCLAGAVLKDEYLAMLSDVGFTDVEVTGESAYVAADDPLVRTLAEQYPADVDITEDEVREAADRFLSVHVRARRPEAGQGS